MANPTEVVILGESDIVTARQSARQMAIQAGFGAMDQSRITTAVSELARNVVRYADSKGKVTITALRGEKGQRGIEVVVSDSGPGIADLERAMRQGFSSGQGLGLGLGGTKRLMDEMDIQTAEGVGTTVTVRKWLK